MWPAIGQAPTYGVLHLTAIAAHFWVSRKVAKRLGLRRRVWITVSICYSVAMTLGAKLLYDVHHSQVDLSALLRPEHYMAGGLWGGLLAYFLLAVPLAVLVSKHRLAAIDLVAVSLPIPCMIAKLGCLCNGCCYGRVCSLPWAITFPEGSRDAPAGVPLHPTQVYEMLILAALLVIFAALRHDRWRGTMLLWFAAVYGLGRAAADAFRGDTERYVYLGPVTFTQLVCLAAGVVAVLLLMLWTRRVGAVE